MAVNIGSAVAYLELDTSKFSKGFKTAYNDLKVFSDKSATAGNKLRGLSSTFDSVGKSLTKTVTVPLVGIGTVAVKTAAQFDSQMSEVKAISSATGEQFTQLRNKAIEMGAKTKYSASESAQAFKYMAMAGWDTDSMLNSIAGVMNLAAASGEDLASVSDIVTDAMTAFGLSADGTTKVIKNGLTVEVSNATHFADVLAQASRKSNTNVAMMGETFKYVAPVAGALGYSVEDTAVAIGLMANSGIKASQAGTTLRTLLTNMAKPTDTMQSAMDYLGISLETTDGKMKSFSEVMQDLRKSFGQCKMPMDTFKKKLAEIEKQHESGEITEKKYNTAVEDLTKKAYGAEGALKANLAASLAGAEGMSGLLAIVNATDEDFQNLTDSINNCDGVSQDMADTMNDNLNGAVTLLKSAIESALISIGDRFTPIIRKLAENITGLVEKFNGLSDEQKDQIVKWGLIVTAIGPSLIVFSSVTKLLANMGQAFSLLISKINPVTVVITLLVASFATLWKTNEKFRNKVIGIWEQVKGKFQEFSDAITEKINALGFNFRDITDVIKGAWEGFVNVIASPIITNALQLIADTFGNVLDFILGEVDTLLGLFTGNHEQFIDGIKEMLSAISSTILDGIKNIGSLVGELLANVLELFGLDKASDAVRTLFTELPGKIWNWLQDTIEKIKTWGAVMKDTATMFAQNTIDSVVNWFMQLPGKIWTWLQNVITKIKAWGSNMLSSARTSTQNMVNTAVTIISQLPGKFWSWLQNTISKISSWGGNMVSSGRTAITNFISSVIDTLVSLPGQVWNILQQIPSKVSSLGSTLYSAGRSAFSRLWDGIKSIGGGILGWVQGFASKIGSLVNSIVSGFQSIVGKSNEARSAVSSVNGHHANGLDYVPFNGYTAYLHKGERVLTKQENEAYTRGKTSQGDTFNFYNTKPNAYEYARQMKKAKKELLEGF